jgi:hypothetical protein
MKIISVKEKQIVNGMKQNLKDLGLKILEEDIDGFLWVLSPDKYQSHDMGIGFFFDHSRNVIDLGIVLDLNGQHVPIDKIRALYDLSERINLNLVFKYFRVKRRKRIIWLATGFPVKGDSLNEAEFKIFLYQVLGAGCVFQSLIGKCVFTA